MSWLRHRIGRTGMRLSRAAAPATALALCVAWTTIAQRPPRPGSAPQGSPPAKPAAGSKKSPARPSLGRFRSRVEKALADARARKAFWGVLIADAATGETLFELDADRHFVPGSNAKLFTTSLALATLGLDYRFRTTIESRGTLEGDGRLQGDLVLVGRGDPDLSNRKFPFQDKVERDGSPDKVLAEMADRVVAKGVKQIEGDVVADDSYFPFDPYPPGWAVDDLPFGFAAPVSAIAVNDNTVTFEVRPGERAGDPAAVAAAPWDAAEFYALEISTGPADSAVKFGVYRRPGAPPYLLRGTVPVGHAPVKLDMAITEPAEAAARLLKHLLEARGVRISGQARARHAPPPESGATPNPAALAQAAGDAPLFAEHFSPPLLEVIRLTNKVSQNLHAEMLLRVVAREKTGIGSTEAGLKVEQDYLNSAGIAEGDVVLYDGSGLSGTNLVTPRALVALLRYIAQQTWGEAFLSSLPVAGKDGTLESRLKDTAAAGRIRAKTGTLEHDRAISGFATTLRGNRLVFSMFANNNAENGRDATAALDGIATAMVEEIGAPPRKKRKR